MEQLRLLQTYKSPFPSATSMVTLIIPPKTQLSDIRQTMRKEAQTASNIKSNTNRKSVLSALTKINECLRPLKSIPQTGLALFSEQYI